VYNGLIMANLSVNIGTFGCGQEYKDLISLSRLGAIVTKTITLTPSRGNPMPRTIETPYGMLNSIGLENQGIGGFIKEKIPFLSRLSTKVIVSIGGESAREFKKLAEVFDRQRAVDAIELNISCPNIRGKTKLIAQDPKATFKIVSSARKVTRKTIITKLSPNVTDIAQIARAAQDAGSDALSLINTVYAMSIDLDKREPRLASKFGGLSGPAIKPIALYMVYQAAKAVRLPIIGMGGIMTAQDALEFMLAGATAVAVGTANYVNPKASIEIIKGIEEYLVRHKIANIKRLVGALKK
jgi:dihydroorotate dehydrogenase (NAD+) catalytic subunit